MKIVLIGGQAIPGIGGVETYILNMANALYTLGHSVTIICSNRQSSIDYINGIEVVHYKCPKSNIIALPLLFLKSIGYIYKNRKSIDIVNYQAIFFAFLSGWITRMFGCRVCYTIHSLAEDNPKHNMILKLIMKISAFISIWLCGKNILTISQSKAQEIKSRYGKRCYVVPCGVNMPTIVPESNILERFNIKRGYYYLTIGRIDPIKNLDILIKAFGANNNYDFQLVIAGDYSNIYGSYLRTIAQEGSNVIFVGSVMGADKDTLLRNCFINCLVSSSEGMPISLLEAMAYGKPCIVSDIPAIREIVQKDWVQWCKVKDIDSLSAQMRQAESNYIATNSHGRDMATYISNNHTWNIIARKYINYIGSI